MTTRYFDAETVHAWRAALESAWDDLPEPELTEGWSLSGFDPAVLLAAAEGISLKPGYKLALYLYRWGRDGNGITWALPAHAPIPAAADCPLIEPPPTAWTVARMADFDVPHPPLAIGDLSKMLVIQPNTADSYLRASLVLRELAELGAAKHGQWWSDQALIHALPSASDDPAEWTWQAETLDDLRPRATQTPDGWVITFYSVTAYGGWRIFAHQDQWGEAGASVSIRVVANAPGGKRA